MDAAGVRHQRDQANPWTRGRSAISATAPPSDETPQVGGETKSGHGGTRQVIVVMKRGHIEITSVSLETLLGCIEIK